MELNRIGIQLYEKFLPSGPYGREGRRGKAVLEIENIVAAWPLATDHHENSRGLDTPLHRCVPNITKPFSHQTLAYETNKVMAEHCQNVGRIQAAVAKTQATASELELAIANARQLAAESGEVMTRVRKIPKW